MGRELKKMVAPAFRRQAVQHALSEYAMSFSRACKVFDISRSSYQYSSKPLNDEELRKSLLDFAYQRHRYGYRRLTVLLRREGFTDNHKRIERIYREEKLQVKQRKKRRTKLSAASYRACHIVPGSVIVWILFTTAQSAGNMYAF